MSSYIGLQYFIDISPLILLNSLYGGELSQHATKRSDAAAVRTSFQSHLFHLYSRDALPISSWVGAGVLCCLTVVTGQPARLSRAWICLPYYFSTNRQFTFCCIRLVDVSYCLLLLIVLFYRHFTQIIPVIHIAGLAATLHHIRHLSFWGMLTGIFQNMNTEQTDNADLIFLCICFCQGFDMSLHPTLLLCSRYIDGNMVMFSVI